ncbi:neural cell adhesion molecule 2-like isoform X1 [Cotesia glomerata]|uniref:neural cell adhesion molecule 2-like isoform X1 n=1 Tax=Cotesia glomerata TaxID=32391 RepID=UPI001D01EFDC|nr:neural cell adhesion molecule 2-like isoform X1 [Cotesia glomerata]
MINLQLCLRKSGCVRNPRHLDEALVIPLLSLWIIGSFCVKDIPISHVVAIVGDPTYLPCDISTSDEGDSVHLVLWYREDLGASVYSIDARDRDFDIAERWSDDAVFSNRAYFRPDKKPAELGVDRIREEDAGIYRCRVDFRLGQTRNSKVNLTVIVPPKKVVIIDENGITRDKQVGPYLEGDDLELHCDVYGGKPPPSVTWYRGHKLISNKPEVMREGVLRSTIIIKNLGRRDVQSELTCSANNNNRSIPLSATVRIDMTFGPLDVKIIGANQPLSSDKRYDLVCATSGSRPPALVTWWRDGQRLNDSNETTSNDGNVTTSVLSFVPSKSDAGRHLSCRAENPIMGMGPIEDEWVLEIQYRPETRIQLGTSLNRNAIREGTDVYFDCLINAKPGVYKVEWRHDNRTLQHNTTLGIIISNQSLVLQGVERRSAGNYTCVGFNTEGDGESKPFHLNVMFAPTCKPNQTKIHGVAKQEKANISCQVDANPPVVEFRWTFNNSAESIDVAAGHIIKSGTSSVVSYTPMTELDYGTLLCWANNAIGNQLVPCVYHIIPAGHPDMVHNCTTHNASTSSFSLRCTEGFNGGLQQSFLLEVRESNSQEIRANLTSSTPQFSVSHLEPGLLYHACVYAFNEKGRSEPMVVQAGTLRLPEKQLTSETAGKSRERPRHHVKLTPMLSVMIGVVAALVIVAVIVMIVLRIQNGNPDDQGKPHLEDLDKNTKVIPIQRELRFREGCNLLVDEKHTTGTFGKSLEASAGELSETDDKNPDIIPQQVANFPRQAAAEEPSDYVRKRRLQAVSTIDTSPSRSLLEQPPLQQQALAGHGNYVGYCTIRSGMPLRELSALTSSKHKSFQPMMNNQVYETGMCTLPRQHWPSPGISHHQSMTMTMNPPVLYTGLGVLRTCPSATILTKDHEAPASRVMVPQQRCVQTSSASSKDSSGMPMAQGSVTKRESSV